MINKELVDYIKSELAKGHTIEIIKTSLINSGGWNPSDLEEAFSAISHNTPIVTKRSKLVFIIPIIILFIGGSAFAGWKFYEPEIKSLLGLSVSEVEIPESGVKSEAEVNSEIKSIEQVNSEVIIQNTKSSESIKTEEVNTGDLPKRIVDNCIYDLSQSISSPSTVPLEVSFKIKNDCKWNNFRGYYGSVYIKDKQGNILSPQVRLSVQDYPYKPESNSFKEVIPELRPIPPGKYSLVFTNDINFLERSYVDLKKRKDFQIQTEIQEQVFEIEISGTKYSTTCGKGYELIILNPNDFLTLKVGDKLKVKWKACNFDTNTKDMSIGFVLRRFDLKGDELNGVLILEKEGPFKDEYIITIPESGVSHSILYDKPKVVSLADSNIIYKLELRALFLLDPDPEEFDLENADGYSNLGLFIN